MARRSREEAQTSQKKEKRETARVAIQHPSLLFRVFCASLRLSSGRSLTGGLKTRPRHCCRGLLRLPTSLLIAQRRDHLISIRFGWASGFFATVTWRTPLVSSAPIESTSIDSGSATVRVTLP